MKGIILAAGKGTRMKPYTEDLPKGMLEFNGKPVLSHIITAFRACDINDIIIVKGFKPEKINIAGVRYCINKDYDKTNMVESLFCAEQEFDGGFILSYSDILFEKRILKRLLDSYGDVVVTVDLDWKRYWQARYGKIDHDIESLSLANDGRIIQLGKPDVRTDSISGRFVGLMKFSDKGAEILREIYHNAKSKFWNKSWQQSGNVFQKAYMTDILQEIIDQGIRVDALKIKSGWFELDTVDDYEKATLWLKEKTLQRFFSMER